MRFNGQAAHVDIDDGFDLFDGATPFTIEAWMKFWSLPTENDWRRAPVPINLRGANQLRITLADGCSTPDRLGVRVNLASSGWTTPVESNQLTTDQWYHFAIVFCPENGWALYENGELVSANPITEGITEASEGNYLGGEPSGANKFIDGAMQEVRFWNRALEAAEVERVMNTALAGDEPGLVAYWPLQDGQGGQAEERAGGRHGRLVDGPAWTLAQSFTGTLVGREVQPGESIALGPLELRNPVGEVSYQWYRNGHPVANATAPSLTIASATVDDLGVYHLEANDERERTPITSRPVELPAWPVWHRDLEDHDLVEPGGTATFGPVELYAPVGEVTYQWYFNDHPIEGATNPELTVENITADNLGVYHVVANDDADARPVKSSAARLPAWPAWRVDLADRDARLGGNATFGPVELYAPVGEVTYQWYFNGQPIKGATSTDLTVENITDDDLGVYHVVVDDDLESTPVASRRARLLEPDWPMWRFDAARSAATPHRLAENLHLQWVRELPEPRRAWAFQWDDRGKLDFDVSYAPVVLGERIFVPSNVTDSVTAYHIEDGRRLWRFHADGPVRLAPAAWQGRVYFVADDGHLYCVDAETGELVWKLRGGPSDRRLLGNERIINFWAARGGPAIKDSTVYFAAGIWPLHGVFIYALEAETGALVWVNDTTSSDYVRLPHGGADGYGGLVPQGYIAADQDRLVVTPGRGQSPMLLDRATGEVLNYSFRGRKGGGGYAVHAVDGGGLGKRTNEMIDQHVQALREEIDGEVFYSLAARDRLFVTTECGKLYCFGPQAAEPVIHEYRPAPLPQPEEHWLGIAANLINGLGEREGYALVLGIGSGDLVRAMLHESDMHTVVVDNDRRRVQALRDELVAAGMYGYRAAVIEAAPKSFSVQPYLFSVVACEDAAAIGFADDPVALARMLDRLRPYRSFAYLGNIQTSDNALQQALAEAGVDQVLVRARDGFVLARRSGPLTGAGQWTHQLHDSGNTTLSREERVKLPLGMLWFGGPSNHNILPRHAGGPRPQVAGGRIIHLGVENVGARCVYTGRQLWDREFPGIGHPFTNLNLEEQWQSGREVYMTNIPGATYIGSPLVTLPDAIFLRYRGEIHRLDPATGETVATLRAPGRPVAELYEGLDLPDWGHISVSGDFLVTTGEPHLFEDQELGQNASFSGTSSRMIAVFDINTGRRLWRRRAEVGFRHNAIVGDGETLFIIDGLSEQVLEHLERRAQAPKRKSKLMALDLRTGQPRWQVESGVFGTFLLHSRKHGILIEGGSRDMRFRGAWGGFHQEEPRNVAARRDSDGSVLWEIDNFLLPATLHQDMLIPGRPGRAVSVLTGETWEREQPLTGAGENWSYSRRYGCNTLNASVNLLLYRTGYAGFFDLANDSGTGNFSGFRSGCTPNMIPADGVLSALDYTRTCTCSYGIQTSLAMIHMPDDPNIEFWTRYDSALPDPRGHGVNFGAPGRRVDVAGSGLTWHDRPGSHRRHASAIKEANGSIPWVLSSMLEADSKQTIRIDDVVAGSHTLRLHFAELDPQAAPGDRVFHVLVNGETMIENLDVTAAAGGQFRGLVHEFKVETDGTIALELEPAEGSRLTPIINGLEVLDK